MIKYKDWTITSDGLLARQYDNLSRRVEVIGELPEGWQWELLVQVGDAMDILLLESMEGGVGYTLTADQLSLDGYYTVQLRGRMGEVVKHTNTTQVFVSKSLSGTGQWPTVPSEFTDVEARIMELNEHPPIPGLDGTWMIWDPAADAYKESTLPLPEFAPSLMVVLPQNGLTEVDHTLEEILAHVNGGGMVILMLTFGDFPIILYPAAVMEDALVFMQSQIMDGGYVTLMATVNAPNRLQLEMTGDELVTEVNGQTGAVHLTAADVGALSQGELQSGVNTALAQAKASGEFDGADGAPGPAGADGAPGKDNLPNVVNVAGSAVALTLDNNVEYHCADAVTALTIQGFTPAADGKASVWAVQFTAGAGITVTIPDTVQWAVAEPVFTAGVGYWLSFVPLVSGEILGVWVSDE